MPASHSDNIPLLLAASCDNLATVDKKKLTTQRSFTPPLPCRNSSEKEEEQYRFVQTQVPIDYQAAMTPDLSGLARRSHRDACRDNGAKAQPKKPIGYPTPRFAVLDQ
jgi:hypothetical protein